MSNSLIFAGKTLHMIKEEDIEKVGKAVKAHSYGVEVKMEFNQNFDEEAAEVGCESIIAKTKSTFFQNEKYIFYKRSGRQHRVARFFRLIGV